jgi:FkbM family methyltransferase
MIKKKIKKLINQCLGLLGYKVVKKKSIFLDYINIDENIKFLQKKNHPIIFDLGANRGQSIKRFKKIFPYSKIYSFEPIEELIKELTAIYNNDESIILNNCAVGDINGKLKFNQYARSGISSFNNVTPDTKWINERIGKNEEKLIKQFNSEIVTLDDYCFKNNINSINLLKIDVQGYESKVLKGAVNLLKFSNIDIIELEMHHDEIYENTLNIYDLEKYLIPNKYKLFLISNGGSLMFHDTFKYEVVYISDKIYQKYKENFKTKKF